MPSKYDGVPILPTRHGNRVIPNFSAISFPVPILPTRHGNENDMERAIWECEVPILPTRHGNENNPRLLSDFGDSSDPTYEAWKHPYQLIVIKAPLCSDPTYEAWKPACLKFIPENPLSFRSYLRGMETPPIKFGMELG